MENTITFNIKTKENLKNIAKNKRKFDKAMVQYIEQNKTLYHKITKKIQEIAISLFFENKKYKDFIEEEKENYTRWNKKARKAILLRYTSDLYINAIKYLYDFKITHTSKNNNNYYNYNFVATLDFTSYIEGECPSEYRSCDNCNKIVHIDDYYATKEEYLCPECFYHWLNTNNIEAERYFKNTLI